MGETQTQRHADTIAFTNDSIDRTGWRARVLLPLPSEMKNPQVSNRLPVAKLTGGYASTEDYLRTYFQLLLRDAFGNLIKGISDFLQGHLDPRDMTILFDVSCIGVDFHPRLVLALQFTYDYANSSSPQALIDGDLLCICDRGGCFERPIWAMVMRCIESKSKMTTAFVELLEDDPAGPSQQNPRSLSAWARLLQASDLVVAQSPTYYKAYQPVLRALQQMDPTTMPFQSELVLAKSPQQAPAYLNSSTTLDWSCFCVQGSQKLRAGIHELSSPTLKSFRPILDKSQVDAVVHVLRNRMPMIQGPPGTGKTFLSVKIVELLLSASTNPQKPIIIVALKNATVDKFLEQCLKILGIDNIIRAGDRSESDKLKSCNLLHLLSSSKNTTTTAESMQKKAALQVSK